MTEAITAALRAYVVGFPADQAGIELLIGHGGFLTRPAVTRFVDTFACISDGTPMTQIDWQCLHTAWHQGQLAVSGGQWRILKVAASLTAGTAVSLPDTLPGLYDRNLRLVLTAIRHAVGQPSPPLTSHHSTCPAGRACATTGGPAGIHPRSRTATIRSAEAAHTTEVSTGQLARPGHRQTLR